MAQGHPETVTGRSKCAYHHIEALVQRQHGLSCPEEQLHEGLFSTGCIRPTQGMVLFKHLSKAYLKPPIPKPTFLAKFPAISSFEARNTAGCVCHVLSCLDLKLTQMNLKQTEFGPDLSKVQKQFTSDLDEVSSDVLKTRKSKRSSLDPTTIGNVCRASGYKHFLGISKQVGSHAVIGECETWKTTGRDTASFSTQKEVLKGHHQSTFSRLGYCECLQLNLQPIQELGDSPLRNSAKTF